MRILIVEDEHRIANSIKKGLQLEKYALAVTEEYDLILLDLMLPGMDGIQICKELRQKQIHTPILMLTAKSQTDDKIEGLDSGADDYLTKPFSFEELLARIRALIRRPPNSLSNVLTVRDISLNTLNFEVKRQNKLITLSGKEFSLLEYLMRHPGQIIKKDQIINHVWDYESNILPNTVEVYIKKLRQKIDNPFPKQKPLIHTVRGFGYKISN